MSSGHKQPAINKRNIDTYFIRLNILYLLIIEIILAADNNHLW